MAEKHYDILLLGESLAAQIAAVLLARSGRRVLLLQEPDASAPRLSWIPVSRHLEGVLDLLGGRSCLISPAPFQVITSRSRLTFHGNAPLHGELRREFPTVSDRVAALLKELREIGESLESALWEAGGLPLTGMKSRLRFCWQRVRHRLGARALYRPLGDRIARCEDVTAAHALRTLFAGLALCPSEQLTVAEGALLWRSFGEGRGVSVSALAELLEHRFEQFHGETAPAATLQSLKLGKQRPAELVFNNGRCCTADSILLGNRAMASLLPPTMQPTIPTESAPAPVRGKVLGRLSPVLAPNILLGEEPALRLALIRTPDSDCCQFSAEAAAATPALTTDDLYRRLAALIPFTDLQFAPGPSQATCRQTSVRETKGKAFPGATQDISAGPALYICSGRMVLPSLGATGEVLTGVTLAKQLERPSKG